MQRRRHRLGNPWQHEATSHRWHVVAKPHALSFRIGIVASLCVLTFSNKNTLQEDAAVSSTRRQCLMPTDGSLIWKQFSDEVVSKRNPFVYYHEISSETKNQRMILILFIWDRKQKGCSISQPPRLSNAVRPGANRTTTSTIPHFANQ